MCCEYFKVQSPLTNGQLTCGVRTDWEFEPSRDSDNQLNPRGERPATPLDSYSNGSTMIKKTICVLAGDGVGPEVIAETIKVLHVVENATDLSINFQHKLMGGCAIDATGNPLPDETLAAAKAADAVLLGAVGGPKWGTGKVRPEQGTSLKTALTAGLLRIRKEMDTFANLRPCSFASESLLEFSPLKAEIARGTNFMVVRELCGGVYFGSRKEDEGDGYAEDIMSYSRAEIERVARLAATLCMEVEPPLPLFSLDKANVLATSRLWRNVVTDLVAKEFPTIKLTHHLIDSAAMLMVKSPRALNGVIVTENMFGDIITDEASVIPGSLGLLPSASLTGIPEKGKGGAHGIYEPIHGSAPDIAGKGIVNPIAAILSAAMLLKYSFNMEKEAQLIEDAVRNVLDSGLRTKDLGGSAGTVETGDAIAKELEKLMKK